MFTVSIKDDKFIIKSILDGRVLDKLNSDDGLVVVKEKKSFANIAFSEYTKDFILTDKISSKAIVSSAVTLKYVLAYNIDSMSRIVPIYKLPYNISNYSFHCLVLDISNNFLDDDILKFYIQEYYILKTKNSFHNCQIALSNNQIKYIIDELCKVFSTDVYFDKQFCVKVDFNLKLDIFLSCLCNDVFRKVHSGSSCFITRYNVGAESNGIPIYADFFECDTFSLPIYSTLSLNDKCYLLDRYNLYEKYSQSICNCFCYNKLSEERFITFINSFSIDKISSDYYSFKINKDLLNLPINNKIVSILSEIVDYSIEFWIRSEDYHLNTSIQRWHQTKYRCVYRIWNEKLGSCSIKLNPLKKCKDNNFDLRLVLSCSLYIVFLFKNLHYLSDLVDLKNEKVFCKEFMSLLYD